jgi:hypothetical protein
VNADKNRRWSALATTAWLLLGAYVSVSVLLVAHYQPKVLMDRGGGVLPEGSWTTFGGQLYQLLAPVWQYNRFLVPALLIVAIALTIVAQHRKAGSRGVAA